MESGHIAYYKGYSVNKFFITLLFGAIVVCVTVAALDYVRMPIVQFNPDGQCVRVVDFDAKGIEISRPCSTVDLENGRYHKEVVSSK